MSSHMIYVKWFSVLLLSLPVTIWGNVLVVIVKARFRLECVKEYYIIIDITAFFLLLLWTFMPWSFVLVMRLVSWSSHWFYDFEWVCFCVSDNVLIIRGLPPHKPHISLIFSFSFSVIATVDWWAEEIFLFTEHSTRISHRKQHRIKSRSLADNYRYVNWAKINTHHSTREHIEIVFQLFFYDCDFAIFCIKPIKLSSA